MRSVRVSERVFDTIAALFHLSCFKRRARSRSFALESVIKRIIEEDKRLFASPCPFFFFVFSFFSFRPLSVYPARTIRPDVTVAFPRLAYLLLGWLFGRLRSSFVSPNGATGEGERE